MISYVKGTKKCSLFACTLHLHNVTPSLRTITFLPLWEYKQFSAGLLILSAPLPLHVGIQPTPAVLHDIEHVATGRR